MYSNLAEHTHNYVMDIIYSTTKTTFAYSKAGLEYTEFTWLAGWNGYELRAVHKNQFATASHNHDGIYAATNHTHSYMPFTTTTKKTTDDIAECALYYCGNNTVPKGTDGFVLTGYYNGSWSTQFFQHWDGAAFVRGKAGSTSWGTWYRLLQQGYHDPVKMTSTSSNPASNGAARFFYFVKDSTTKDTISGGF